MKSHDLENVDQQIDEENIFDKESPIPGSGKIPWPSFGPIWGIQPIVTPGWPIGRLDLRFPIDLLPANEQTAFPIRSQSQETETSERREDDERLAFIAAAGWSEQQAIDSQLASLTTQDDEAIVDSTANEPERLEAGGTDSESSTESSSGFNSLSVNLIDRMFETLSTEFEN